MIASLPLCTHAADPRLVCRELSSQLASPILEPLGCCRWLILELPLATRRARRASRRTATLLPLHGSALVHEHCSSLCCRAQAAASMAGCARAAGGATCWRHAGGVTRAHKRAAQRLLDERRPQRPQCGVCVETVYSLHCSDSALTVRSWRFCMHARIKSMFYRCSFTHAPLHHRKRPSSLVRPSGRRALTDSERRPKSSPTLAKSPHGYATAPNAARVRRCTRAKPEERVRQAHSTPHTLTEAAHQRRWPIGREIRCAEAMRRPEIAPSQSA